MSYRISVDKATPNKIGTSTLAYKRLGWPHEVAFNQSFRRINVTKAVRRCCQSKELMEANMIYLKDEWRGNDIFLLGTMHVSEESAKEVQRAVEIHCYSKLY
jgi:predicted GNAT family N-acyltransferase